MRCIAIYCITELQAMPHLEMVWGSVQIDSFFFFFFNLTRQVDSYFPWQSKF